MQMKYDFAGFENIIPRLMENTAKKAILKAELISAQEICLMIKVVFFQKNWFGTGLFSRNQPEIGQKLDFRAFCSKI